MKINVFADLKQFTVVSSLTVDDITKVAKYRPDALTVRKEDGTPVFAIGMGSKPCVAANGVTFNGHTHDGGFAMATFAFPADAKLDEVKAHIADMIGAAEKHLTALETSIPTVLAEINAAREATINAINVVGATQPAAQA